ncbi:MAG: hypothetical protein OXR62_03015 [Ahrensia sp.]|nr:hypothetical protein [Ahrensia sp.]
MAFSTPMTNCSLGVSLIRPSARIFATLEFELLDRRKVQTKTEALMAIFEFIEGWYNPT